MIDLKKPLTGISVIGIDPSLTSTGLVLIRKGEVIYHSNIKTSTKMFYSERIAYIAKEVYKFFAHISKFRKVDVIAIEMPYIGRIKGNSTLKVAEARGAIIGGISAYFGVLDRPPIEDIAATEAKKAVGVNSALKRVDSKPAVKEAVERLFPEMKTNINQDILDACAIATAGAKKFKTKKILTNL